MSPLLKFPRLAILLLLISLPTFSALLITPALPLLTKSFSLTPHAGQWVMSLYLCGFALGPLIYGPLGNRFGRKRTLSIGLLIALIGTLLALFAPTFWMIVLARFLQAFGTSAGLKITFTMVGDLHAGKRVTKALSILMLGLAIAPSFGIAIGGYLTETLGWRSCFAFLSLYVLLLLFCIRALPETAQKLTHDALRLRKIAAGYLRLLKTSSFLLPALLRGLAVSMIYVFATEAPFVAIHRQGLSPSQYGLFNLLLPLGAVLGLSLGNRLADHFLPRLAILLGLVMMAGGIVGMAVALWRHWPIGWSLFIPQAAVQMGSFFVLLFGSTISLTAASDKSDASAVMQFINLGCATVATLLVGAFIPKVGMAIPLILTLILSVMLLIWAFLKPAQTQEVLEL